MVRVYLKNDKLIITETLKEKGFKMKQKKVWEKERFNELLETTKKKLEEEEKNYKQLTELRKQQDTKLKNDLKLLRKVIKLLETNKDK